MPGRKFKSGIIDSGRHASHKDCEKASHMNYRQNPQQQPQYCAYFERSPCAAGLRTAISISSAEAQSRIVVFLAVSTISRKTLNLLSGAESRLPVSGELFLRSETGGVAWAASVALLAI